METKTSVMLLIVAVLLFISANTTAAENVCQDDTGWDVVPSYTISPHGGYLDSHGNIENINDGDLDTFFSVYQDHEGNYLNFYVELDFPEAVDSMDMISFNYNQYDDNVGDIVYTVEVFNGTWNEIECATTKSSIISFSKCDVIPWPESWYNKVVNCSGNWNGIEKIKVKFASTSSIHGDWFWWGTFFVVLNEVQAHSSSCYQDIGLRFSNGTRTLKIAAEPPEGLMSTKDLCLDDVGWDVVPSFGINHHGGYLDPSGNIENINDNNLGSYFSVYQNHEGNILNFFVETTFPEAVDYVENINFNYDQYDDNIGDIVYSVEIFNGTWNNIDCITTETSPNRIVNCTGDWDGVQKIKINFYSTHSVTGGAFWTGTFQVYLNDVEVHSRMKSPLRIAKDGKNYGIALVNPGDPMDSGFRIQTSSGIKALRLY